MAIQQVTTKPEHIKKAGSVKRAEMQSDKGEDMFSIVLSLSMNVANQGVKDTGLAENKIEGKQVAEAADKKEGSDDENKMKGSRVQGFKGSSETSMSGAITKGDKHEIILRQAQDDKLSAMEQCHGELVEPLPNHDGQLGETSNEQENSLPFKGRGRVGMGSIPGELHLRQGLTKGDESAIILRQAQDDKHSVMVQCHGELVEPLSNHNIQEGFDTTTDFKLPVDIISDSIVNPQIENLDNNKLLNDNGMLVTAVKGTPVNTDGNNISSQSVYRYADQGNLVQYMSQQIIHASHVGTHTAKISLKPAELGDLRLDISVADKNVKALIVVENEEIKKMVESGFNSLRDELKNQGLNIEQFSVEIQKDDFMDNFKSMYERHEKGSKKWENIVPDINTGSTEHPLMMPLSLIKGGLSLFA